VRLDGRERPEGDRWRFKEARIVGSAALRQCGCLRQELRPRAPGAAFICSSVTRPKRLASAREERHERVPGFERIGLRRPVRARTRAERSWHSIRACESGLHGRAHRNIRLYDRRGLGHAYIDKMANARARRSFRSGTTRGLIDSAKLGGFRRVRMTDADQLHESIRGRQMRSDGCHRQGI